jgi:hypothetical protein
MLLGRSVAEFSSNKEAKLCDLSQKLLQKLATAHEMCNEISSSKGEETKEWFEHCQTVEESAHN